MDIGKIIRIIELPIPEPNRIAAPNWPKPDSDPIPVPDWPQPEKAPAEAPAETG